MSVEAVEERAEAVDPESDAEAAAAMGGTPNGGEPDKEPEGDLEGQGADEQAAPELAVEGSGQLSLKIGGSKPTTATIKLRGGSIHVDGGQIEKGESLNLVVSAVCSEVHLVDKRDNSTGEITVTERRQIMKITGVEKV